MSSDDWTLDANCLEVDPEIFFVKLTPRTSRVDQIRLETALSICKSCPVKDQCKKLAEDNWLQGVFGGEIFKLKM